MSSSILPGVIRGLGKARIKYDLIYKNKIISKTNFQKFSFLEKLNLKEKEFSKSALFKTLKYFSDPDLEEVIFWTVLKLINAQEMGGICVPKNDIKKFILEKNPNLETEKTWKEYFTKNSTQPLVFQDENMFYLTHLYQTEVAICKYLHTFFTVTHKDKFKIYKDNKLSDEQISIVNSIYKNSISFLSGGPGTGKTTIIQAILKSGIQNGIHPESIAILAPTGKAAKRLHESCLSLLNDSKELQIPSTIHRFLGYNPSTGKFKFNSENPIHKDVIIVDEASMVDIFILKAILDAFPNDTCNKRLIFVGDPDQLLSVSSGSIFSDFIRFNKNIFKLTNSFRQTTEGEEIKVLANKIKGIEEADNIDILLDTIQIEKDLSKISSGVKFIESDSDENSLKMSLEWYQNLSEQGYFGQILTPYNETKIGVISINSYIEKELKASENANTKLPVVVNSNLYDLELFNGESGYLVETPTSCKFIHLEKKEIEISKSYRQYFDLAYAITVHKSQGSEYDHVCLFIPSELELPDSLLNIRILYTAITRAKKSVTIIGSFELFKKALLNNGEVRYSQIVERLIEN